MKKLVVLSAMAFSALFSAKAFAGLDNVSWSEIQKERARYFVDAPGAFFVNSNPRVLGTVYKRFISVDGVAKVCVAGDKIYGGKIMSCVKTEERGSDDRTECVKYEPNELYAPLSGVRTICVDHRGSDDDGPCQKWQTIPYKIDTNVKAKIYHEPSMDRDGDNPNAGLLGTKTMQLPACG